MYKVMIIDDEEIVLEGLMHMIDWNGLGCEISDTAMSAEEGIKKIKKQTPDIIITDIRMKSMTGLEMIEAVSDRLKNTKVIIMTAYRNFEYAQTAIALGVVEFILKPTKLESIKAAVRKSVEELDERHRSLELVKKLEENNIKFNKICIEKILSDACKFNDGDWEDKLKKYNEDFSDYFVVSTVSGVFGSVNTTDFADRINKIFNEKMLFKNDCYIIYAKSYVSIVVSIKEDNVMMETIRKSLIDAGMEMGNTAEEKISVGVSKRSSKIAEIHEKMCESYIPLESRLDAGAGAVNFYEDTNVMKQQYINVYQERIFLCISAGNKKKIDEILADTEEYLWRMNLEEVRTFVLSTIMMYYECDFSMKAENGGEKRKFNHFGQMIERCGDKGELIQLIGSFSVDMINKTFKYNSNILNEMTEMMITYIKANYQHSLSREDVANHVHASTSYVSTVFKNVTGQNLTQYINTVRINEAKRLLSEGKHTRQEIAGMVGYNDYAYFSSIFKKLTGKSPSKWQKE